MDRVFNSVIRSAPGAKSTGPVPIPALMLLQSQHKSDTALMGAILQRLAVDDENSSAQTLVMLLNLSLEGRIKNPRDVDDMLAKITAYGQQHTQWPETLRWICALTHFHCTDVMTVAQLGEIDAMDVPTAALVNFANREDCAFAASVMIEHFTCVAFKAQTLVALRLALQGFPANVELCRAVVKAVVNATTFWGGSSDPSPSVDSFVNNDGAGVAALLAAMQGPLSAHDDVVICTRALANFSAYHREATRAPVVQAVLDVLAAFPDSDAVASNVLAYLAQGSSHADVQAPKVLDTVLSLFATGVARGDKGNTRLLTDVIHTLGAFATHWKESKSRMATSGVVEELLTVMQKYASDAVMQQQSCNLLSYLCFDSEVITNTVTRSGGVVLVLNSMRKFRTNEPLLTAACAAVSGLTFNNPAGQSVVKQEDAVPLLLDILSKATRPRLVEMVCLALGTLCWNIELKAAIADAEGIDLIVNALSKHATSSGVVKNACRALAQIAFNSEKYRDDMTQRGAIRLIIHGMSLHPQHDRAQLHACAALSYLSWTSSSNATDILQHDGYRAIIRAMSHNLPNHEVQEHACRALANITGAPPADTENALQSIVEAMHRHDRVPEVQEEACRAIVTLALAAPENKTKLFQKGVAAVVVNALRRFSNIQLVQQEAANAIAHLAYEHAELNKAITDLDAVNLLITAMRTFPANSKLQLNACGGLSALAFNNQVAQRQVSDLGGVPHILRAMKEFDRVRILELGCSLLGTLAWNPQIKEKVAEACVPTIIVTMRNHPENPCLQKATIRAAAQFAFDSEKNRVLLYDAGAVSLIIKALRDHMSNSKLVSHALVALTYLCWENGAIAEAIIESDALDVVEEVMRAHTTCDRVLSRAQHLCKILQRKASPTAADTPGFPNGSPLGSFSRPGASQSGSFSPPGSPHKLRGRNAPPFDDMSDINDSPVSIRGPGGFPRGGGSASSSFASSPVGLRSTPQRPSSAGGGRGAQSGAHQGGRGGSNGGGGGRGAQPANAWQSRGQAHRGGNGGGARGK